MTLKIPLLPDHVVAEQSYLQTHKQPQHTPYNVASSDDTVKVAIADRDNHIVIYFGKRINWLEMPNSVAISFAQMLLRRAGFIGTLTFEETCTTTERDL